MAKISVLIVNFNAGARLKRCLDCLQDQTFRDFEVIVVDNASEDGSIDLARESGQPFELIEAGGNLGFAAGNNLGARRARGDWLAFLNPDAYARADWLQRLIDATEKYPDALAFGSTQLMADDPSIIDGAGDVYHAFGIAYRGHHGWPATALPEEGACFAPCAAAAFYERARFESLGGFDERFFCYGEDVDLAFRLRLQGGAAVQLKDAVVLHEGSGVTGRESAFTVYHGNRNRIWLAYKNTPGALYWPLAPVRIAVDLYLLIGWAMAGQAGAYLKALRDGYGGLGRFRPDRKRIAAGRKITIAELARQWAWNPLLAMRRRARLWPLEARPVDVGEGREK